MNKLKLFFATLLLALSAGLAVPSIGAQVEVIDDGGVEGGECIYAEYLSPSGVCSGATTRLCKGPPSCPRH